MDSYLCRGGYFYLCRGATFSSPTTGPTTGAAQHGAVAPVQIEEWMGRVHKANLRDRPLGVPQMQSTDAYHRLHPRRALNQGHHEGSRNP